MTTISAKIIADSINETDQRITTFQLRYPRFIHSEVMTHRVFSRNAQSNRAIPFYKLVEDIHQDTAIPLFWGKNQPGMQASEQEIDEIDSAVDLWYEARNTAIASAEELHLLGLHKQVVNRLLEPFQHINVIITTTDECKNFFELRDHPDAEPHIRILAKVMKNVLNDSTPKTLDFNKWHLPYVTADELQSPVDDIVLAKYSAARCARVSYMTHEQKSPNPDEDLKLAEKLLSSKHMSPFEHAAQCKVIGEKYANFHGWKSLRYKLETPSPFDRKGI